MSRYFSSASFGSTRDSSISTRRRSLKRALRIETLEARALLAADIGLSFTMTISELSKLADSDKELLAPTHHYFADGQQRGMVVLSDRIAIRASNELSGGPTIETLQAFGLEELRPLESGFVVYATQQPLDAVALADLKESGWIENIVPVFGMIESQSEAVLLNEVIVALPTGVSADTYFSQDTFLSYRRLDGTPDQFVATLSAGFGEQALAAVNQLLSDTRIAWASPNFYQNWQRLAFFPNDPRFSNLWHLHNTGQAGGLADADPNLPEAWQLFQPGGPSSSIVVGVVDDGVATNHPDLFNWVNPGELGGDGVDNDGNGWIDDISGWNFVDNNNTSQPSTSTDNHGTAVAGVAAARGNNGIGVTGASYNSPVISSRIFRGNAVASDAGIASSIFYTAGRTQNGLGTWPAAHIVNHSWGGGGASTAITGAVTWATTQGRGGLGVPQVFAAGNSFGSVIYPATLALSNPGVIAVGAMNNQGQKSNYSSFGPAVDIVTPSNDSRAGFLAIDTTDRLSPGGYNSGADYTGTGSAGFGGTSSAAPLATGIGALAFSRAEQLGVELTAAQLRSLMRNNTKLAGSTEYALSTGRNDLMGYGLLNAETLVRGIGRAQISVTTSTRELDSGGVIDLGQAIVGGINEVTFRVRNQGTETLVLSGLELNSPDFVVSQSFGSAQLGLGEATTFSVRFNPTTPGPKNASLSLFSNDSLLPELQVQLLGEAQNTTISGFFFEDRDGNGIFSVGESILANQTVFIDQNGNGVFDSNLQSTTLTNSTPAGIFDQQTTTSTINVSGVSSSVTDVRVTVNLNHTYLGDLTINLIAPDGTRVLLFNRRGGSGDNLVSTVFSDQAAQAIAAGTAPFTGSFRPEQPLSNFSGTGANGNWTLEIRDNANADQGVLLNWTLELTGGERVAVTDDFGFYYFLDVPNGEYSLIGLIPEGWTASGPNAFPFTVSSPADSFTGRNVGVGKNNRFYARVFEDTNRDGQLNPGESALAGQTLFLDANSNGIFDPVQNTTWTNSTPTPITDLSTINLPVVVAGVGGAIADVDVSLNLNHTFVGDLEISLISPDGQQIMLSNRRGGSGDNFVNTRFDDDASESILAGSAPFTGSFRPETPLSLLNGLQPNGAWNLRIRDLANADTGTFLNWTLSLTTQVDVEAETDQDGWVSIDLTPSMMSTITLVPNPGWEFTVPADGSIQVTASGQPFFNQLFGTRVPGTSIDAAYVYHRGWSGSGSAIDTSKILAKEGLIAQTLGYEHLINTSRGINGVVLEFQGLTAGLTSEDFLFQVSPTGAFAESLNPPSGWELAPEPSAVGTVAGAPDQVLIEWSDNAIANRWLRVTVLANENTGLSTAEVYYIGHLLGETTGATNGIYTVNFADISAILTGIGQTVDVTSPFDIDKNSTVTFADISAMRANVGGQLTNITIQADVGGQFLMSGTGNGTGNGMSRDLNATFFSVLDAAPLIDSLPFRSQTETVVINQVESNLVHADRTTSIRIDGDSVLKGQKVDVQPHRSAARRGEKINGGAATRQAAAVDQFFAELTEGLAQQRV